MNLKEFLRRCERQIETKTNHSICFKYESLHATIAISECVNKLNKQLKGTCWRFKLDKGKSYLKLVYLPVPIMKPPAHPNFVGKAGLRLIGSALDPWALPGEYRVIVGLWWLLGNKARYLQARPSKKATELFKCGLFSRSTIRRFGHQKTPPHELDDLIKVLLRKRAIMRVSLDFSSMRYYKLGPNLGRYID